MKILIKNATVLTMDEEMHLYAPGYVLTRDGRIEELGEEKEVLPEADETIDAGGGILLPGFINTHCHVPMMPFRSLGDDCPDRLRRFLFPLENEAMTKELVALSARYGICEMLLAGVTTFTDMYYFEDEVAKACEELGIRGVLGETVIGQRTCDSEEPYGGLLLAEEFIKAWKGHELVTPIIAPHATNTNSAEMLKKAYETALKYDTLCTLHASEMDYELKYFKDEYGQTPIEFLNTLGVLGDHLLAAHCIHLTERDISLLSESKATVSHCIGSNTKAGKGVAPVKDLLAARIPVGLGTDGASSGNTLDLFTQMRLFASFHKTENRDRSLFPAKEIVKLATTGGAKTLHMETALGSLEPGKKADMVLVETDSVNMFPCYDPYSALVYSANASNVELVMVGGKVLVRGKRLVYADLEKIRKEMEDGIGSFRKAAESYI
ncbi:amidohydrolase [Clostridium transplantifaecale]|uniref:amidohydrolase n=1 Tax=Clostridium transplantifaecale TaxID=2479838 RepID=UPI000F631E6D|nr:amidohydrolase [Clostridium transplantifaecale]